MLASINETSRSYMLIDDEKSDYSEKSALFFHDNSEGWPNYKPRSQTNRKEIVMYQGKRIAMMVTLLAITLLGVVGVASASTNVTFRNRTGYGLYLYYDIVDPGGTVYCWTHIYGGYLEPNGRQIMSVPEGQVGFFNFRTCPEPCDSECDWEERTKDIGVWINGAEHDSFTYDLW